jgi:hypothetical protein
LIEEGTWGSRDAVKGRAVFEVAGLLEEMGNVPAAARLFLEATRCFGAAKGMDPGQEAPSVRQADAIARRKLRLYSPWSASGQQ